MNKFTIILPKQAFPCWRYSQDVLLQAFLLVSVPTKVVNWFCCVVQGVLEGSGQNYPGNVASCQHHRFMYAHCPKNLKVS